MEGKKGGHVKSGTKRGKIDNGDQNWDVPLLYTSAYRQTCQDPEHDTCTLYRTGTLVKTGSTGMVCVCVCPGGVCRQLELC